MLLHGGIWLTNPYTLFPAEPADAYARNPGETGYVVVEENGIAVGYIITGAGAAGEEIFRISNLDTPEGIVKKNCLLVREAAESFMYQNNHVYPADIASDTDSFGATLLDCLNGYLENPYTSSATEPRMEKTNLPGEIGYEPIYEDDVIIGYRITGVGGSAGKIIAEYRSPICEGEGWTRYHCDWIEKQADEFAYRNDGKYPKDIDTDTNNEGRTLLYKIRGYIENPYTHIITEPRNRRAYNPGEIGYEAIDEGLGYAITGVGKYAGNIIWEHTETISPADTLVLYNYAVFQDAIEEFVSLNDGIGPMDLYNDTLPSGETVIDLLPGGDLLLNPVTGLYTEPRNHRAAYPGQVGYYSWDCSGNCFGYQITAIGEGGEYIRIYGGTLFYNEPD